MAVPRMRTSRTSVRFCSSRTLEHLTDGPVDADRRGFREFLADEQPCRDEVAGGVGGVDDLVGLEGGCVSGYQPADLLAEPLQGGGWQAGADAAVAHDSSPVRAAAP
jgi:hypothetical protein